MCAKSADSQEAYLANYDESIGAIATCHSLFVLKRSYCYLFCLLRVSQEAKKAAVTPSQQMISELLKKAFQRPHTVKILKML